MFPIQSESGEQVASRILAVAEYGLPADYNDTYQQKVLAVGQPEVKAMAGKYFDAGNLEIVLVGNVKAFKDGIQKEFPKAKLEELPFDQIDVLAPDLRRPKPAAAAASAETLEKGRKIMLAAAEAAGGPSLTKIESLEFVAKGELSFGPNKISADMKTVVAFPDRYAVEITVPMGTMRTGFDGRAGWLSAPNGVMDLPAAQNAEQLRTIALVGGWGLMRQVMENKSQVNFIGEETVEGRKLTACEWTSAAGTAKLYIDPASGMLVGSRYRAASLQGPAEQLELWSDFKPVEGNQFPFKMVQYRDGNKAGEMTITSVKVNTSPEASVFSKPAK